MPAPAPLVLADRRQVGSLAAELVLNRMLARPGARLGFEPGSAPAGMFAALRAHAAAGELPSASASVVQLVSGTTELEAELRGLEFGARHLIDDAALNLDAEALRHAAESAGSRTPATAS